MVSKEVNGENRVKIYYIKKLITAFHHKITSFIEDIWWVVYLEQERHQGIAEYNLRPVCETQVLTGKLGLKVSGRNIISHHRQGV